MVFKFNKSNKKLLLILAVFILSILSQSALNYSFSLANQKLDDRNKQLFTIGILGENIVRKLGDIQSLFYQLTVSDRFKKREIIKREIGGKIQEIIIYLDILEKGGRFSDNIDINLPNADITTNSYLLNNNTNLKVIGIDIRPKLSKINEKVSILVSKLNKLDSLQIQMQGFISGVDDIRQFVKSVSPLFIRTIENANRIYYEFITQKQQLEIEISDQKQDYKTLQILLTIIILVLGIAGFYVIGRQMQSNNYKLEERKDYVNDILKSQSNIIIVNDGNSILDASGGFFDLFNEYKNIEEFSYDYDCICDTFVKEKGFLSKEINGVYWVEYVANNPEQTHKAKILYNDKYYIYQANCVKSKNYDRYIISMFDITEIENIQQDLEVQKNTAIKAKNSKSEFLANMSHEIRTPLNAILGFISLLKEKNLDTESNEYLKTIDSSGQSLLAIVNDVLDFSKIEDSKLVLDPVDFNTQIEFNVLANLFKKQCSEKNINLQINLDENIPETLNADILRIKQVITNLLSNAIKFTPKDKEIAFSIVFVNNSLEFIVKDSGIGISSEEQLHIFEKFSQAKSSTTREYGGTGLGLAISSKLVELMGGKIELKSKQNSGSIFSFKIPVKNGLKVMPTTNKIIDKAFVGKVLLAEDNLTNQMLMKVVLSKQNIEFDLANDGVEALEMFKNGDYSLILMDNNMPNMSGIDSCKNIREYEKENNLKPVTIVALTASTTLSEREEFIAVGMDDYLSKPVEIPKLIGVLSKYL
jgi:CheY-like chemotaxis protein/nitrogen-specific signal transduction histidine kinase